MLSQLEFGQCNTEVKRNTEAKTMGTEGVCINCISKHSYMKKKMAIVLKTRIGKNL